MHTLSITAFVLAAGLFFQPQVHGQTILADHLGQADFMYEILAEQYLYEEIGRRNELPSPQETVDPIDHGSTHCRALQRILYPIVLDGWGKAKSVSMFDFDFIDGSIIQRTDVGKGQGTQACLPTEFASA